MDILLWIAIFVLILLPPSFDPAIRIKMRQVLRGDHCESFDEPVYRFVSWYQEPKSGRVIYLRRASTDPDDGYIYVSDKENATHFETFEAADLPTPRYDGSSNIEKRAGVERIRIA